MSSQAPTLRTLRLAGVSAAAILALPLAFAGPAAAGQGDPPGNNGTIKIHGPDTPPGVNANEPQQVCAFYIAAFNYDTNQVLTYTFAQQGGPNTGTPAGTGGSFAVGPDGNGQSRFLTQDLHNLPDGRYKVSVVNDDNQPPKSKVFNINCPGGSVPGGSGVGGVGNPDRDRDRDEDEGPGGVGGVDTGGGALSGGAGSDVAFPLTAMAVGGALLGAHALRRRSSN